MKLHTAFFMCLWATLLVADEPSRTWTSKQGLTLQGSMAGVEDGMVLIKKANGDIFKAKLDALSQADVDYVNAVSFGAAGKAEEAKKETPPSATPVKPEKQPEAVPDTPTKGGPATTPAGDDLFGAPGTTGKVIKVSMVIDPNPLSPSIKEIGVSSPSKLNDRIALSVSMAGRQGESASLDSTWTLESLDSVSGTLKANTAEKTPLKTDGMFYFLTYSVENGMDAPLQIPIAIVTDSKKRKFYPLSAVENDADAYIPEGMLYAEKDRLQPGLKKRFCAIYELPKDCIVCNVEIFPIRMTRHPLYSTLIKSGQLKGKTIEINTSANSASPDSASTAGGKTEPATEKASVFMSCRAKTQKTTSNYSQKTRVLAYSVDLRLNKPQQKDMTIKAYFIADDKDGDAIADTIDQPITLQQGKSFSTTVESKPVSEGSLYSYSYGAKLKGVIIQLWADGSIVSTWTSMPQWDKYAKMPDIQLKMRQIEHKRPSEEDASERRERKLERRLREQ